MPFWTLFGLRTGKATTAWPEQDERDGPGGRARNAAVRRRSDATVAARNAPPSVRPARSRLRRAKTGRARLAVDYGRCVVCQLLRRGLPVRAPPRPRSTGRSAFANRDDLVLSGDPVSARERSATARLPAPGFRRSLHIRHVDAGSCNGCESELQALNNPFYNLHRFGIFFTPSPRFADLLLVTGR